MNKREGRARDVFLRCCPERLSNPLDQRRLTRTKVPMQKYDPRIAKPRRKRRTKSDRLIC